MALEAPDMAAGAEITEGPIVKKHFQITKVLFDLFQHEALKTTGNNGSFLLRKILRKHYGLTEPSDNL